jgi:hypothetical protein
MALRIAPNVERFPKITSIPIAIRTRGQKRQTRFQVLQETIPRFERSSRTPTEIRVMGQKKDLDPDLRGGEGIFSGEGV